MSWIDSSLLVPVFALGLVTLGGRIAQGTWLAPASFFAFVWTVFIALNLSGPLFGVDRYDVWVGSLWWIFLCLLLLSVGSVMGAHWVPPPREKRLRPFLPAELPFASTLMTVFAIGGLFWEILVPRLVVEGDHPPMYLQVLLGFHYLAPLMGGAIYGLTTDRRLRLASVAVLGPGLLFALLNTGRSKVVIQLTFWFAGYISARTLLESRPVRMFTRGHVLSATACLLFIIAIGIIFTPFRGVQRDLPITEKLRQYAELTTPDSVEASWEWMHSSIFGHVAMFSWYFERAWKDPPSPKFPEQTAAGFFRAFGGVLPEPLYTDIGGVSTNVFTIFKPPIEDYTLSGALAVFFFAGLISGWAYAKVRAGAMWPMALLMFYYTNATVIGGWMLTYNAITGAFIGTGIYLHWVQRRTESVGDAPMKRQPVMRSARGLITSRHPVAPPFRVAGKP